jgi:CHAT domain-containing protein
MHHKTFMKFNIYKQRTFTPLILTIFLFDGFAKAGQPDSPFSQALNAARENNFVSAIEHLKQQLAEDPSFTEGFVRLADFYWYDNNLPAGAAYFERAIASGTANPNFFLGYALLCTYNNDWRRAFENSQLALEQGAPSPLALQLLVESALQLNSSELVPAVLNKIKKSSPYDLGIAIWKFYARDLNKSRVALLSYLKNQPDIYSSNLLGKIYYSMGRFDEAAASFFFALKVDAPNRERLRIVSYHQLGRVYLEKGKVDSAAYFLNNALSLAQKCADLPAELEVQQSAMDLYKATAMYHQLEQSARSVLALATRLNQKSLWPNAYLNLALVFENLEDYDQALQNYLRTAEHAKQSADPVLTARGLYEAGRLCVISHDWENAQNYLSQSIEIAQTAALEDIQHLAWLNLADMMNKRGNMERAKEEYGRVLRYAQSTQQHTLAETCLVKLAHLYLSAYNSIPDAHYYLTLADALAKETFQLQQAANIRWMQGKITLMQNDIEKAETYFLDAIQLGSDTGSQAAILAGNAGLIKTYLAANFPDLAAAHADTALHLLNDFIPFYVDEKIGEFFDLRQDLFLPAVTAYSKKAAVSKIYEACEKLKAFQHIKNLTQLSNVLNLMLPDSLQWKLETYNQQLRLQRNQLWESWRRDQADNLYSLADIKHQINQIKRARSQYLAELAGSRPEYASVIHPAGESIFNLRAKLDELNGTFIHYLIGDTATDIIVVRADTLHHQRVNFGGPYLEKLVEQISPLLSPPPSNSHDHSGAASEDFRLDLAGQLYQILFEPIQACVPESGPVIISSDQVLHRLPFECLVTNPNNLTDNFDYRNAHFLVERYSIFYVPYAKFLDWPYPRKIPAAKPLIAFANSWPQAGANGSHLHTKKLAENTKEVTFAVGRRGVKIYTGSECSLERFHSEAGAYSVLHLALPTILEDCFALRSRVCFTDSDADVIDARALFTLKLQSDLAVLTTNAENPCDANSGQGLSALLHGFNYSGVPALVASRWQLEEERPNEVLRCFYSNLKLGMNKAEALQKAKLTVMSSQSRNPVHWAGLVLLGDPQAIELHTTNVDLIISLTIVGVLVLIIIIAQQFFVIKKAAQPSELDAADE